MKNKRYLFLVFICLLVMQSCASIKEYPVTRKVSQVDLLHGVQVEDPYRWLEDFTSEEVEAWVGLQNNLSQRYLTKNKYRKKIKENLESINTQKRIDGYLQKKQIAPDCLIVDFPSRHTRRSDLSPVSTSPGVV